MSEQEYPEQGEAAKPQPIGSEMMKKLGATLDRLEGQRNALWARLEDVCAPEDAKMETAIANLTAVPSPYSLHTQKLQEAARRVNEVASSIQSILDRLEI